MKRIKNVVFMAALLLLVAAAVACSATYTVTFDYRDGGVTANYTIDVKGGEKAPEPDAPIRDDYDFGGWYFDTDLTDKWNFNSAVNSDITLYAKWTPKTAFTITVEGGSGGGRFVEGKAVTVTADSPRGKKFVGWYADGVKISDEKVYTFTAVADIALEAKFNDISYTLTYMLEGAEYDTQLYIYGQTVTPLTPPQRDKFVFAGWAEIPGTMPDKDVVVSGRYTRTHCDIVCGGASGGGRYAVGDTVTLTAEIPTGYVFVAYKDGDKVLGNSSVLAFTASDDIQIDAVTEDKNSEDYFEYTLKDGTYSLKAKTGAVLPADVVLPSYKDDCAITALDSKAFKNSAVRSIKLPDTLTVIGSDAFSGCRSLTAVTLPTSVSNIGTFAFQDSGLKSISLPDSVTELGFNAFSECDELASVSIGKGLELLSSAAFANCVKLSEVSIPDTVKQLGTDLFKDCTSLTTVNIGAGVVEVGSFVFGGCVKLTDINVSAGNIALKGMAGGLYTKNGDTLIYYALGLNAAEFTLPAGVRTIYNSAFYQNTALKKVTLGNDVVNIGAYAFTGSAIAQIDIGGGLSVISENAFQNCSELTAVALPSGVSVIRNYTFLGCGALTNVTLGAEVSVIGNYAFADCAELRTINLGAELNTIGAYAFKNCAKLAEAELGAKVEEIGIAAFSGCTSLNRMILPDRVTSVPDNAFENCGELVELDLNKVESVGKYAFSGTGITELILPDGIKNLGESAFESCKALTKVVINPALEEIPDYCFEYCRALVDISVASVSRIGRSAFADCVSISAITVPDTVLLMGSYVFVGCDKSLVISCVAAEKPFGWASDWNGGGFTVIWDCNRDTDFDLKLSEGSDYYIVEGFKTGVSLTDVEIPAAYKNVPVEEIAANAFVMVALNTLILPASVTTVGEGAFYYCGLKTVTFAEGLKTIGKDAFRSNDFTSLTLPAGLLTIGDGAFRECGKLAEAFVPGSVATMGSGVFRKNAGALVITVDMTALPATGWAADWNYDDSEVVLKADAPLNMTLSGDGGHYIVSGFAKGESVADLIVPAVFKGLPVEEIAANAFVMVTLNSLILPASITTVGEGAFYYCGLKTVTFAEGLKTIGKDAFRSNDFTSVTLPAGLLTIGDGAFRECGKLAEAFVPGSVATMGSGVFRKNAGALVITVDMAAPPAAGWDVDWNYDDYAVVWAKATA